MTSASAVRTSVASPAPPSASNYTPRRSLRRMRDDLPKRPEASASGLFSFWATAQPLAASADEKCIDGPTICTDLDRAGASPKPAFDAGKPLLRRQRLPNQSKPPETQAFPLIFCPDDIQSRKFSRHSAQMHGSSLNSALHNMAQCLYINLNSREHRETLSRQTKSTEID